MISNIWDVLKTKGIIHIGLILINGSIAIVWLWLMLVTPNYKADYRDWIVLIINGIAVILNISALCLSKKR